MDVDAGVGGLDTGTGGLELEYVNWSWNMASYTEIGISIGR